MKRLPKTMRCQKATKKPPKNNFYEKSTNFLLLRLLTARYVDAHWGPPLINELVDKSS